ncbi:uncharacterized protein FOMMEDRAFT_170057 [Fomitiporia mediterranea MF3/22]|uniref:uncharacterized protein n=1 Tax=Fomitiporia mediterranea (strain MF3/22) TaxID=694068 RepID=UPI0004409914|nr:uncharacterized protein FOMMEDRAFT_170057 [Fomitiporia mediterranea MF3/22]EJC99966.1 hypothetical protein FOMMEDRAFT_170057 [Fomitiporia mediterranea MF3/22]
MLANLDIDVILQVLSWLQPDDIISLRATSKHFYSITHLRTVWYTALTNLLSDNTPLARMSLGPDDESAYKSFRDLSQLSTSQLERLVFATSKKNRIWGQRRPERTRATRMLARVGRVFVLRFLRICSTERVNGEEDVDEGRYLLSFGHTHVPTLCMQVWDVEAQDQGQNGEQLVDEWVLHGRMIGIAFDEGNGLRDWYKETYGEVYARGALIAVSARCFGVPGDVMFNFRIMCFTPLIPSGGNLSPLASFRLRGPLNVRAMHGRRVAVQVRADGEGQVFGHGVLKVVDWVQSKEIFAQAPDDTISSETGIFNTGREFAVKLEPSIHGLNRAVLRVQFVHDWVLVFRESVLEFYFVPPSSITKNPQTIRPTTFYKWAWQINTLAVAERISWIHDRMASVCRICNGSGSVLTSSIPEGNDIQVVCACRYHPLSIVARFDSYYPWPVNLLHHFVLHVNPDQSALQYNSSILEAPYTLPPTLSHTVPSTVRLFGHSVLIMGQFGTLLWTDSEANNFSEGPSDEAYFAEGTGERVAGRRLRLPLPPPSSPTESLPVLRDRQDTDGNRFEFPPAHAPVQLDATGLGTGQQTIQQTTSVFATRLTEGWYSLALCESKGRIAIGDGEGGIEVWDHF